MTSAAPAQSLSNPADRAAASALWIGWTRTHGAEERAKLIAHYREFSRMLAARCFRHRFSGELEFDDYLQFAQIGLIEAVDRFDPARGVPFEAFAERRIKGAILNGTESLSEKQRQIATRVSVRRERARSLKENAAAEPAGDARDPLQRLADIAIGLAIGFVLDDAAIFADTEEADTSALPYERLELAQLRNRVDKLVDELPDVERRVIRHHYYQHVPFDEIARSCDLSKSRISQIHHAAIERLRRLCSQAERVVLVT